VPSPATQAGFFGVSLSGKTGFSTTTATTVDYIELVEGQKLCGDGDFPRDAWRVKMVKP
jgi:hypothetical protein